MPEKVDDPNQVKKAAALKLDKVRTQRTKKSS